MQLLQIKLAGRINTNVAAKQNRKPSQQTADTFKHKRPNTTIKFARKIAILSKCFLCHRAARSVHQDHTSQTM